MLRNLSDTALTENLKILVKKEREVLNQVLDHLEEMERRKFYLKLGFSSLFEYCTKELGYSEGAAQRRISSMRLIKEIPQVKEKIESGELNLTTLSMAQSFFRREEKEQRTHYTAFEKSELLKSLEAKSKREVEKELIKISPASSLPKEKERLITSDVFEISFQLTQSQMKKLSRLKELKPNLSSNQQTLEWLLDYTLKKIDPMEFKTSSSSEGVSKKKVSMSPTKTARRYISKSKRAMIWKSAKGQCEYVSPVTNKRCFSTGNLQIDHIHPVGLGGTNEAQNLRLLCQQHNIYEAINSYGPEVMGAYLSTNK